MLMAEKNAKARKVLSCVVVFSFFLYLLTNFIFGRFGLESTGQITSAVIFSLMWIGLIGTTSRDLFHTKVTLNRFFSDDDGAMAVSKRLQTYEKVNSCFGFLLCVFQVLVSMINDWFKSETVAALLNLGFDIACIGVTLGFIYLIWPRIFGAKKKKKGKNRKSTDRSHKTGGDSVTASAATVSKVRRSSVFEEKSKTATKSKSRGTGSKKSPKVFISPIADEVVLEGGKTKLVVKKK